jgi:diphthamide synthase (EF-2-diphthine--ammonia ligase)
MFASILVFTTQKLNEKLFVLVSFSFKSSCETLKFQLWKNSKSVEHNVSPLGEGGDFETQINQVEQKLQ